MTIEFIDEYGLEDLSTLHTQIEKVLRCALETDHMTDRVSLSVTLTDDENMRKINRTWRNVDSTTDVLSFPLLAYDPHEETHPEDVDPETGEILLGDLVVSVPKCREQAAEYGHSFEREIGYLCAHGLFHLLGYDHEAQEDKEIMRRREEETMEKLGLARE
ncbi:MAG: rRNA maturation RNase YbeY [Clostridia bacterium]|nr:rRNA maturation RNase YbeY [Clostridia bacterium]